MFRGCMFPKEKGPSRSLITISLGLFLYFLGYSLGLLQFLFLCFVTISGNLMKQLGKFMSFQRFWLFVVLQLK